MPTDSRICVILHEFLRQYNSFDMQFILTPFVSSGIVANILCNFLFLMDMNGNINDRDFERLCLVLARQLRKS